MSSISRNFIAGWTSNILKKDVENVSSKVLDTYNLSTSQLILSKLI